MNSDLERKAFEADFKARHSAPDFVEKYDNLLRWDEKYNWYATAWVNQLWETWQARAALSTKAQPEVTGGVPVKAIATVLEEVMALAVANGANSVSMPDHYVEIAAWLSNVPPSPSAIQAAVRGKLEEVAKLVETMQKYPIGYKRRNISIPQAIRALIGS